MSSYFLDVNFELIQIAFPLIVCVNCYFLCLFIEEEWNPDGKGRQSNDTGEFQYLIKFYSQMQSGISPSFFFSTAYFS